MDETSRSFLPPSDGLLPYWLLFLSVLSFGNSVQNYCTLHYTRRIYGKLFVPNAALSPRSSTYDPDDAIDKLVPATSSALSGSATPADQITPLAARLFSNWTIIAGAVRLFAAYNLHIGAMYDLCMLTFVIAFGHYAAERLIYRTIGLGKPQAGPFVNSTLSLIWMPLVRSFYVRI